MRRGKVFSIFMVCLILFACSDKIQERDVLDGKLNSIVHLELSRSNNCVNLFDYNSQLFEGVQLINQEGETFVLKVDSEEVSIEDLKRSLNSKGFSVTRQYKVQTTFTSDKKTTVTNSNVSLQIPEISFPNIFKALLVFYQ